MSLRSKLLKLGIWASSLALFALVATNVGDDVRAGLLFGLLFGGMFVASVYGLVRCPACQ